VFCVFSHCASLVISTNAFVSSIAWIDSSAVTCHVLSGVLNCAHWLTGSLKEVITIHSSFIVHVMCRFKLKKINK